MTRQLIDEFVSIYRLPELDTTHNADVGSQITIGDLHGNAMKLIYVLVRHGFITNMTDENYDELVRIYRENNNITAEDLTKFNAILDKLQFNKAGMLRLLGDEMCDRGSNDYLTLKVLSKMASAKVPYEIVLSNHSAEFIEAYESKLKYQASIIETKFTNSMVNLQSLITKELITRDEVRSMIRTAYKPALKALSYSLNDDNTAITIYSHAPIDVRAIHAVAKKLGTHFNRDTALDFAKSIDAINAAYQVHVTNNTVHTLYDKDVIESAYQVIPFPSGMFPFEYIMWNRDHRFLVQPEVMNDYQLFFAHGHDAEASANKNVFNLETTLGKTLEGGYGQYSALYSHEHSLTQTAKLVKTTSTFFANPVKTDPVTTRPIISLTNIT